MESRLGEKSVHAVTAYEVRFRSALHQCMMDEVSDLTRVGIPAGEAIQGQHPAVCIVVGSDVTFVDENNGCEPGRRGGPVKGNNAGMHLGCRTLRHGSPHDGKHPVWSVVVFKESTRV